MTLTEEELAPIYSAKENSRLRTRIADELVTAFKESEGSPILYHLSILEIIKVLRGAK